MANIKQVAALANLSVACVSKYLNNPDSVLPASRQKIEEAIAQLQYIPSALARNLRTKRTGIIKIIMHSITNPYFAEMYDNLRVRLETLGYLAALQVIETMETIDFVPADFTQVDGMILCFVENDLVFSSLKQTAPPSFPVVCIHGFKPPEGFVSVITDMRDGARLATDYLISLGCKRIAYVGGPKESSISREKFSGFSDALSSVDSVSCVAVEHRQKYDLKSGYEAAQELLRCRHLPDAVFCENDVLAAGVIHCLAEHNLPVPDRVRVTGFDNIPLAEMFLPSLTSVAIPVEETSEVACKELLALLQNDKGEDHRFSLRLVVRQS